MRLFIGSLLLICNVLYSIGSERPKNIVVTNGWTAAFAKAAGAKNIIVLAPYEMEHPSEYELKPTDISVIMNAQLIVFAGYETMMKRIRSGMNIGEEKLVKIETDYSFNTLEKSIMRIAQLLGTENLAKQNLDSIKKVIADGKTLLNKTGVAKLPIAVNFFQQSIVGELGFQVTEIFGPTPLEARDLQKVAQTNCVGIVDNEHNPIGIPLSQIKREATYIKLLNFPGNHQTTTLIEVIQFNIRQLSQLANQLH